MSENLKKLIQSIGRETPFLNDVLQWHSKEGRNKYSHFEVSMEKATFLFMMEKKKIVYCGT